MASTNSTTNYELSQFIGSDSPKWLTDYNGDMEKIDAGIAAVKAQADATDLVVSGHTTTIGNINTTVGEQGNSITTLRTDVNTNTGSINTINSLIGNGTPTTTDQTIIGAINELHADITGSGTDIEAENVSYDNTVSGLTATSVQDAIDELDTEISNCGKKSLLWSNPDATADFESQTITLSSDNYDELVIYWKQAKSNIHMFSSSIIKGFDTIINACGASASGLNIRSRAITYVSDTSYTIADAYTGAISDGVGTVGNSACIPYAIYGIKY